MAGIVLHNQCGERLNSQLSICFTLKSGGMLYYYQLLFPVDCLLAMLVRYVYVS
jgi:hypothetical protein